MVEFWACDTIGVSNTNVMCVSHGADDEPRPCVRESVDAGEKGWPTMKSTKYVNAKSFQVDW